MLLRIPDGAVAERRFHENSMFELLWENREFCLFDLAVNKTLSNSSYCEFGSNFRPQSSALTVTSVEKISKINDYILMEE